MCYSTLTNVTDRHYYHAVAHISACIMRYCTNVVCPIFCYLLPNNKNYFKISQLTATVEIV